MSFVNPTDDTVRIGFDDQKTDGEKIVRALISGGIEVPRDIVARPVE